MSNFNADNAVASAATPQTRIKVNKQHGRIRYFESSFDAAVSGAPQIADTITWGDLPVGARVISHLSQLSFSAGTSSSTATVGDAGAANRHLTATSITSAGAADLITNAGGVAGYEITEATKTLTSTIAGAAVGSSQKITLRVAYVLD